MESHSRGRYVPTDLHVTFLCSYLDRTPFDTSSRTTKSLCRFYDLISTLGEGTIGLSMSVRRRRPPLQRSVRQESRAAPPNRSYRPCQARQQCIQRCTLLLSSQDQTSPIPPPFPPTRTQPPPISPHARRCPCCLTTNTSVHPYRLVMHVAKLTILLRTPRAM